MSETTNKHQLQHLIRLMEANRDIARGFHKGRKEDVTRFWHKVENELNSMGPPTKSVSEWKKVWSDQKKYVRHKSAQNLTHKKGTGGGPYKEQKLSPLEETIYELIALKTSVEGINSKKFGLSGPSAHTKIPLSAPAEDFDRKLQHSMDTVVEMEDAEADNMVIAANVSFNPPIIHASSTPIMDTVVEMEDAEADNTDIAENDSFNSPIIRALSTPICAATNKPTATKNPCDLLATEIGIQKDMLEAVKCGMSNMADQHREMYALHKNHFEAMETLKREEIDEMRRHNAAMEQIREEELQK